LLSVSRELEAEEGEIEGRKETEREKERNGR
jgi:hypothetical protein